MAKEQDYSSFGKLLDEWARRKNVHGPLEIAEHLTRMAGYHESGESVSRFLYGEGHPTQTFNEAFVLAFELTDEEKTKLAHAYTFPRGGDSELTDEEKTKIALRYAFPREEEDNLAD